VRCNGSRVAGEVVEGGGRGRPPSKELLFVEGQQPVRRGGSSRAAPAGLHGQNRPSFYPSEWVVHGLSLDLLRREEKQLSQAYLRHGKIAGKSLHFVTFTPYFTRPLLVGTPTTHL
jgi:hypothetical protein